MWTTWHGCLCAVVKLTHAGNQFVVVACTPGPGGNLENIEIK